MTNSDSGQIIDPTKTSSPSFVHIEHPVHSISPISFNDNNYDDWSRSFQLALMAKGKLGYIDGTIVYVKPSPTSDTFASWQAANALVTMWIFNTIESSLRRQISLRPEAKLVWSDIKNRFCHINEARIYQLQAELLACRQGPTEPLMSYYGRMTAIWDALVEHDSLPSCSCNPYSCDWKKINTRRNKKRVRDFVMGLDDRFANTRSQIIGITHLLDLDLVYNTLLQDEDVRNLSQPRTESAPETMAFVARVSHGSRRSGGGGYDNKTDRGTSSAPSKYFCIACQKPGHSLKFCYQVTGKYPEWWGDRPRPRILLNPNDTNLSNAVFVPDDRGKTTTDRPKHQASAVTPKVNMASAQINVAGTTASTSRPPINPLDKLDLNTLFPQELEELSHLCHSRKSDTSLERLNGNISSSFWIIDTGASHHMSGCLDH
ncbi:uncharacterized protein LOC141594899 [Silene latifolia]|uniref:uncharacterized protein LOC141594899 n=1 Tax=Silene latifolia TaxID=37657 RepID=UPI003D786D1D